MAIPIYNTGGAQFPLVLANTTNEIILSASNIISFTQSSQRAGSISVTAGNTINFSQSTGGSSAPKIVTANNTIAFSQASSSGLLTRTASNKLNLTHAVSNADKSELTASNTINFTQTASPGLLIRTASNILNLAQNALVFITSQDAIPLTASDTITFSQSNNRFILKASAIGLTASDTITFTQRAIFPIELTASNTFSPSASASANAGKSATSVVNFTQSVILNQVRNLTASNTFNVTHSFTFLQFRNGVPVSQNGTCDATKQYSPFSGGDGDPAIRQIPPTLTRRTDVLFFYPIGPICNATTSITLRTPNFGDRDRNQYNRINRESRGGSLTVFRDPKWPKERTLVMDYSGIKDSDTDGIIEFLEDTLGLRVGLRDWQNRVWFGIISNPDTAITRTGKDRNDIVIELEVDSTELQLQACSKLELTQSNTRVVE